jgi:lipoate-protein ligase B
VGWAPSSGEQVGQYKLTGIEHVPTYTTGRRDNSPNPDTLHPEEKKVQHVGADFYITKRGGQVTYHGPGQLVGYPIFDLNAMEVGTSPALTMRLAGRGKA